MCVCDHVLDVCGAFLCASVRSCVFQAIVFVVGGGNYIEYQNLADYAKVSRVSRMSRAKILV